MSGSTNQPGEPAPLSDASGANPEPASDRGSSDFAALAALAHSGVAPAQPPADQRSPPDGPDSSKTGPHAIGTAWAQLIDSLAGDVLLTHVAGRRVLDLGHGSPEIAGWVAARVEHLSIVEKPALEQGPARVAEMSGFLPAEEFIDPSGNWVGRSDDSGPPLRLHEYGDASFDVVYSLRTFPHLGFDTASSERLSAQLLREAARVTVDGGTVFVQIANPSSLRGLVAGIRNPITVVSRRRMILGDRYGLTRYDTLGRFRRFLPPELEFVRVHGLGVTIPHDSTLAIPIVGSLLGRLEWRLRDMGVVRRFGALLLVELRRSYRPRELHLGTRLVEGRIRVR